LFTREAGGAAKMVWPAGPGAEKAAVFVCWGCGSALPGGGCGGVPERATLHSAPGSQFSNGEQPGVFFRGGQQGSQLVQAACVHILQALAEVEGVPLLRSKTLLLRPVEGALPLGSPFPFQGGLPDFTCIAAHLGGYSEWEDARRELSGTNV